MRKLSIYPIFKLSLALTSVSVAIGSAVALFLWLLQLVAHFRFAHSWLLYLLPAAGVLIHFMYRFMGKSSEKGNNLIIDEIHEPGAGVPAAMGPLILLTTVITHLFGGSAGREGTAVQIGGSMADLFQKWFKLTAAYRTTILTAGIAAGFGAVFGTPLAGAVFAVEVLTIGKIRYRELLPCLAASFIGDLTVSAWGVHHTVYTILNTDVSRSLFGYLKIDLTTFGKTLIAAPVFGLISLLFSWSAHRLKPLFLKAIPVTYLIPVVGGILIIALVMIQGRTDYLGLGIDPQYPGAITLPSAFSIGGADLFSWLWKMIYTVFTLSTGFKGGEVTPLFYIGATAGNTIATLLHAPISLFAALGFISVFAGATKTPVACAVMGVELFGGEYALFFFIACFIAFLCSGKQGIYTAQRRK
jgi:H+/Cl- antiporter ClcA